MMLTVGPPPGRTGDAERDVERLYDWCDRLYVQLARINNYAQGGDAKQYKRPEGDATDGV